MKNKNTTVRMTVTGAVTMILLILFDQWTKHLAVIHLAGKPSKILIPGVFELSYLENRGAAFGMLQNKQTFFIILTALYLIIAIWFYYKIPAEKKYFILHGILITLTAGAIGNLIDRVSQGYVVDFFYFSLINFPVFNVADIYVTVSMILLIFCLLFVYKEEDLTFLNRKKKEK